MGMRRSFVDWQRYTADTELESGENYLVYQIIGDYSGKMLVATYHDKGDVVHPKLRDDYKLEGKEATAEERLLYAVFGKSRSVTIPENGFYIMTGDYGIDDEYEGCVEMPVCVGNASEDESAACPCYWANLPLEPESYGPSSEPVQVVKNDKIQKDLDDVQAKLDEDPLSLKVYQSLAGQHSLGERFVRPFGPCMYRVSCRWLADRTLAVIQMCRNLSVEAVSDEALDKLLDGFMELSVEDRVQRLSKAMPNLSASERAYVYQAVMFLAGDSEGLPGFYEIRDSLMRHGGTRALDSVRILQEAHFRRSLPFRLGRLAKLYRLGAPEVILVNEARMCVEVLTGIRDSGNIVNVDDEALVAMFGIHADGSRAEGPCEEGDMELIDVDDEVKTNWREQGLKQRTFAFVPNFMLQKSKGRMGCVFDRETWTYLRDENGEIRLFETAPEELD